LNKRKAAGKPIRFAAADGKVRLIFERSSGRRAGCCRGSAVSDACDNGLIGHVVDPSFERRDAPNQILIAQAAPLGKTVWLGAQ
jgi:hypothetical protein